MSKSKVVYLKLSAYFFFFFVTWSASYSLFSIWLGQEINLSGADTGIFCKRYLCFMHATFIWLYF